jgi:hypothetical protein
MACFVFATGGVRGAWFSANFWPALAKGGIAIDA